MCTVIAKHPIYHRRLKLRLHRAGRSVVETSRLDYKTPAAARGFAGSPTPFVIRPVLIASATAAAAAAADAISSSSMTE